MENPKTPEALETSKPNDETLDESGGGEFSFDDGCVDLGFLDDGSLGAAVEDGVGSVDLASNGVENSVGDEKIEVSGENLSIFVDFSGSESGANGDNGGEVEFSVGDVVWVKTKNQTWWPGKILDPCNATASVAKSKQKESLLVEYFGNGRVAWCSQTLMKPFYENFKDLSGKSKAKIFAVAVEKALAEFGNQMKSKLISSSVSAKESPCMSDKVDAAEGDTTAERLSKFFPPTQFEPLGFLAQLKDLALGHCMSGMLEFTISKSYLSAFYHSVGHTCVPIHQLVDESKDEADAFEAMSVEPNDEALLQQTDEALGGAAVVSRKRRGILAAGVVSGKMASRSRKRKKKAGPEAANVKVGSANASGLEDEQNQGKNDKSADLRERKKSKYLSYPYVNWGEKGAPNETERPKDDGEEDAGAGSSVASPSLVKSCSGKKLKKTQFKKFINESDLSSNPELINASPAELLSQLRLAAVDCLYPKEIKNFALTEWFFARFRISAYHDESIYETYCKNTVAQRQKDVKLDVQGTPDTQEANQPSTNSNSQHKKQKRKKSTNSGTSKAKEPPSAPASNGSAVGSPEGNLPAAQPTSIPDLNGQGATPVSLGEISQVAGQGAAPVSLGEISHVAGQGAAPVSLGENSRVPGQGATPVSLGEISQVTSQGATPVALGKNATTPVSLGENFQLTGPGATTPVFLGEKCQVTGQGATPVSLGENSQATYQAGSEPSKRKRKSRAVSETKVAGSTVEHKNFKPVSLVVDLQVKGPYTVAPILQQNNGNPPLPGLAIKDPPEAGMVSPKPKQRKRKSKAAEDPATSPDASNLGTVPNAGLPDLNGTGAESGASSTQVKPPTSSTKVKPPPKKKRGDTNISAARLLEIYSSKPEPKAENSLGTALILTFISAASLPSTEVLNEKFCKFGSLKESETQTFRDSNTARLVFLKSTDARDAVDSLRTNPFGPTVTKFELRNLSSPPLPPPVQEGLRKLAEPSASAATQSGEAPPIDVIRKNLEMMTSMLENSGNNLSPEMKAKLEGEIKGLLKKVSSKDSPSA